MTVSTREVATGEERRGSQGGRMEGHQWLTRYGVKGVMMKEGGECSRLCI